MSANKAKSEIRYPDAACKSYVERIDITSNSLLKSHTIEYHEDEPVPR
jgi:hypothetical protein